MQPPTSWFGRALYFLNLLGDTGPMCLDWTKVGVATSTVFAIATGTVTTLQAIGGAVGGADWALLAAAIGLHGISHTALRVKRAQETQP